MSRERERQVVEGVREQVKRKLLADFHKSLQKTEKSAREVHTPFGESHRLEIMTGFAQGCIAAGAEVLATAGVKYLHYLSVCACTGTDKRILSKGEDQLHHLFHQLAEVFPSGSLPETLFAGVLPKKVLMDLASSVANHQPIAPEDLN